MVPCSSHNIVPLQMLGAGTGTWVYTGTWGAELLLASGDSVH